MAGASSVTHLFQEDGANWKLETGNPGPDLVNTNSAKDWSEMSAGEGAVSNFSRTRAGSKLDKQESLFGDCHLGL